MHLGSFHPDRHVPEQVGENRSGVGVDERDSKAPFPRCVALGHQPFAGLGVVVSLQADNPAPHAGL